MARALMIATIDTRGEVSFSYDDKEIELHVMRHSDTLCAVCNEVVAHSFHLTKEECDEKMREMGRETCMRLTDHHAFVSK